MTQAARDKSLILNLFEVGKDKPNRSTEIVFLERCLQLLTSGGRLGIVLPDGNLNNPSLSWLRRWAEGKARLLAVVSLPEDTFKSAEATVKASLVFLRKFTEEDETTWESAWQAAHARVDATFDACRTELCEQFGPRIACADDPELARLLEQLADLGVRRALPAWRLKTPPPYPRGVVQTDVGKPRWEGSPIQKEDRDKARALRDKFDKRWTIVRTEFDKKVPFTQI